MPAEPQHQKNVQQIKAEIEARRHPVTAIHPPPAQHSAHNHFHLPHLHLRHHFHRSHSTPPPSATHLAVPIAQHTNAAMSAKPSPAPSKASLNSILDSAEAQWRPVFEANKNKLQGPGAGTSRPSPSTRPSWIGPKPAGRPVTPGLHTMPQPVTLTYVSPGLQPPVYAFTSLSEPQWEAVEMTAKKDDKGEWNFSKTFSAEPGEYQYKFRLGPGDWWALDEQKEKVDDGFGNKNNLMVVKEPVAAPLMAHEAVPAPAAQTLVTTAPQEDAVRADAAPLMAHENVPVITKSPLEDDLGNPDAEAWNGDGEDEDASSPPLMRHESLAPHSAEQTYSPLFRHESIALGEHKDDPVSAPTPSKPSAVQPHVAPEADPHDPSLHKFQSDHQGIIQHIHQMATELPADETTDESIGSPRAGTSEDDNPLSRITSLPSVQEDEEEIDQLRETTGGETDPNAPITPPMTPKEQEQIAEDIVTGLMAGESVDEAIERAIETEIVREELVEALKEDKDEDGQTLPEKLVPVVVERKTLVEILISPAVCLAVVGIAVVVGAVGFFVARGDLAVLVGK